MIHVVAMKCIIGLPLLIHTEFYEGVGVDSTALMVGVHACVLAVTGYIILCLPCYCPKTFKKEGHVCFIF
jgi:hypothetical protein